MKIKSLHGYMMFEESFVGEVSRFMQLFDSFRLVRQDEYFTFKLLRGAPGYSLEGLEYLGPIATATFQGKPWEVMRENGFVYDFTKDLVVPITTITAPLKIEKAANYYLSDGLVLTGSLLPSGQRVTSYEGWYTFDTGRFKYSSIEVE